MSWEKTAIVFVISLCLPLSGCLGPSEEGDTRIDSVTLVERPNPCSFPSESVTQSMISLTMNG